MTQASIVITGAANGIGLATAQHFSSKGWFVCMLDINSQQLRHAAVLVEKHKHPDSSVYYEVFDVCSPDPWESFLNRITN